MADDFKEGDHVEWSSHGGTATGVVKRKLTEETSVEGHTAKATPEEPEYLVETDSGKEAIHRPEALRHVTS